MYIEGVSEPEASWGAVFNELKQRGLRGVGYVVSDDHRGMAKAIEQHFQGAVRQVAIGITSALGAQKASRRERLSSLQLIHIVLRIVVPGGGLEPPRPCGLRILSL
jgi:transposase-like protein